MISFINCEKSVCMFPSGKKLADARKDIASYMGA